MGQLNIIKLNIISFLMLLQICVFAYVLYKPLMLYPG